MKKYIIALAAMFTATMAFAAETTAVTKQVHWHPATLFGALGNTAVFAIVGTLIAILCYKIFDWATPGKLHEEIVVNKNVAAAILGGAIIIGVSIIVAVSML